MLSRRKLRCGFCLKGFSNAKHVHQHIANSPKCRAALDWEMSGLNRQGHGLGQGVPPLASNPNLPLKLDHDTMANEVDELAGRGETDISSGRLSHELQSHRDTVEDNTRRYAENYNAADAAHVLRKSPNPFQAYRADQKRLGEEPWAPFKTKGDWELAVFLIRELSQTATDKYLKLPIVSRQRSHTVKTAVELN